LPLFSQFPCLLVVAFLLPLLKVARLLAVIPRIFSDNLKERWIDIVNTGIEEIKEDYITIYVNDHEIPKENITMEPKVIKENGEKAKIRFSNFLQYYKNGEENEIKVCVGTNCKSIIVSKKLFPDYRELKLGGEVLIMHFDDDVKDYSGYNNHGTIHGNPVFVKGVEGKALKFDGVDDYVEIPASQSLNPSSTLTFLAWVKPTSNQQQWAAIIQRKLEGHWYDAVLRVYNGNQWQFAVSDGSTWVAATSSSSDYVLNVWALSLIS
jgi:hypothetical protein